MSDPVSQQRALLQAIFAATGEQPEFDPRGLEIYRRNLHASAARALSISYPTTTQLLGEELMGLFAAQHIRLVGKSTFDWADWGRQFPYWLKQHPISTEHPYLADVAHLDWAIHRADRAADLEHNPLSVQRLNDKPLNTLRLQFAPGARLIRSRYPIVDIYTAHKRNPHVPALQGVQLKLKLNIGQTALVWRNQFQPCVRAVDPSESHWLQGLTHPSLNLEQLLDRAPEHTQPFDQWLPHAFEAGLVLSIAQHSDTAGRTQTALPLPPKPRET